MQNTPLGTALGQKDSGLHAGDAHAELSDLDEFDELTKNLLLEMFRKEECHHNFFF